MIAFGTEEERYTAIVPRKLAERQIAYERRHRILFLREHHKLWLKTIGKMIGVTQERVRQMQLKAERERRFGVPAPIARYMELADMIPEMQQALEDAHRSRTKRGWRPPPAPAPWFEPRS